MRINTTDSNLKINVVTVMDEIKEANNGNFYFTVASKGGMNDKKTEFLTAQYENLFFATSDEAEQGQVDIQLCIDSHGFCPVPKTVRKEVKAA